MKRSRHPGLRLKMTLAFALVFILLSVGLNLYSYDRIRRLIIADDDRYLLTRAQSLLDKTEVNPAIIPLPDKNAALQIYYRANDRKVLLFQSPGPIRRIKAPTRSGVVDTLGLRAAYVINSSDDNPAELLLAVSDGQLRSTLDYLLLLLVLSSLLSVVISAAVSFWLTRFFLLPVQRIIGTAKKINAHQLRERVPIRETHDELQELTETINAMLERIDQSLQQQKNFFASASHELKTPLAIMRAQLEVTLKKPGIDNHLQAFINGQLDEINRLQQVVQEFLVISQIKEERLSINRELFDLSELCLKVFRQLRSLAEARRLKLSLQLEEHTPGFEVSGDKEKIKIVLINLLENAIKYSPAGSTISCVVGSGEMANTVKVAITNPTMAQAVALEQLAQAFYRQDDLQPGAGIGLWLSRELLDAHRSGLILKSNDYCFQAGFELLSSLT